LPEAAKANGDVRGAYLAALLDRGFVKDRAQAAAVERLQRLSDELITFRDARRSALRRLLSAPSVPRGVYFWGGVGRGKSFLMDAFYGAVPIKRKTRIHFHEFMRAVHRELDTLKGQENPLKAVALRIARRFRLICFDEFHVSDIADAMILHRLLSALFDFGVVLVMTSNYRPDDLYPDGLHRERMLDAIELIKHKIDVLNVDGGVDYRQLALSGMALYYTPLDAQSTSAMTAAFEKLREAGDTEPVLAIEARRIEALRRAGGVVWFDFATLCGGPRSQNDYLELAARFHTVLLSEVPQMSASMSSEARRFTWLIDVLYDHGIKLIMSAQVEPQELYTAGTLSNEFHRTVSRIIEMQSDQYLSLQRRAVVAGF
jgi:cell division protein ZapE